MLISVAKMLHWIANKLLLINLTLTTQHNLTYLEVMNTELSLFVLLKRKAPWADCLKFTQAFKPISSRVKPTSCRDTSFSHCLHAQSVHVAHQSSDNTT